jgi:hypothetical protein
LFFLGVRADLQKLFLRGSKKKFVGVPNIQEGRPSCVRKPNGNLALELSLALIISLFRCTAPLGDAPG